MPGLCGHIALDHNESCLVAFCGIPEHKHGKTRCSLSSKVWFQPVARLCSWMECGCRADVKNKSDHVLKKTNEFLTRHLQASWRKRLEDMASAGDQDIIELLQQEHPPGWPKPS